ncbi:PKD domain-containing protein, partial [Flavobacterium proteolyticum]
MGFKNYLAIVVLFILGNVQNIFAQPSNDACASAIPLTVTNGSCSSILYTNVAATTVGSDPAPACWSPATRSHTVWFSFVATTADIELSTNFAGTLANTQIGVYSGTCGSLTQLACQEDVNTAGGLLHTNVILHGLTIGNTYYVMVDGNGTSTGTFGICAQETLPVAPPSPIQDCDTAQFLCNKNNVSIPNGTGGPGLVQTNPSCFGSPGERASWWYTFTVATSGTLNFTITPNGSVDYDFAVYNVTTGCPGTELVCNWDGTTGATGLCGTAFGCENTITVTAGQTYAILVDRYTSASTFGFVMDFTGTTATFTSPTPSFTASAACLGQATNFTNTTIGSNTYSWNFGDGFTSNLENPSHTYAATGTYNVTLLVTTVPGGCQNQIIIPVTVSPIPTVNAGSDTSTCSGACVTLSGATNATGYTGPLSLSNTTSYTIPDSSTTGVSSPINVTGVLPATIGAGSIASVCINLSHGWDSDLDIFLRCPDGTLLELSTDNGGSGSNYTSTCFTPTAVNVIGSAGNTTPPFTGTYAPEQAFSTLNGCTANGTWELFVQDDLGGVTGTITGWTITFNNTYPPFVWSPTTAMTGANTLTPSVCPTSTTTYTLTAYGAGGCVVTDTVLVTVTPGPTLTLTSAAATTNQSVCANSPITNITYSVAGGATGATVSGLPAGVTGSYLAGVFTISGTPTTPGTYNYTVTTTGGGCTAATATGVINVNNAPVLTSITSTTPICSGNNAVFNLTGTPNAIITYNINGGTSQTITLSAAGTASVTVPSVVANTTLNATNVAAAGTSVIGNGLSASGGINPTNATGVISALGAAATTTNCSTIDNANNTQTITLQHLVPAGTIITISIARDNNQGSVNISDGTSNIGAFSAGPNDILQQITVTTTVATNTIVITRVNGTTWVDGVQYTIILPGCSNAITSSNTVVVSPLNTIAAGTSQTVCVNSAITNITLATTGATGATFTGLPAGVTGSWAANVVTISG